MRYAVSAGEYWRGMISNERYDRLVLVIDPEKEGINQTENGNNKDEAEE